MSQVLPLLRALLAGLERLHGLLDEEAASLSQGKADDLPELTRRKTPLLVEIARLWNGLAESLNQSAPLNADHLTTLIHRLGDQEAVQLWSRADSLARSVSRQNSINGKLIQEQLRHAHAAMQILQDAVNRGGLYGADGQSLAVFSSRRKIDEV